MKRILVTGASGQLGMCIQSIHKQFNDLDFVFMNSKELDIADSRQVQVIFDSNHFDCCLNCAAYTNVEQAEKTPKKAFAVNADGVKNIAIACKHNNVLLIHISTDYVFDGEKNSPYTVDDEPNPINEYGKSKLQGEAYIQETLEKYFIIRTSWLYSEFGQNFYKTILKKAKSEETVYVTDEQLGCPTNAKNLSKYILDLLASNDNNYGIHHFTDGVAMTWYGFAKKILEENGLEDKGRLEKAKNYRTFARRPKNSVLA